MNQRVSRPSQKRDCGCGCGSSSSIINNVIAKGHYKTGTVAYAKQTTVPPYKSIKERFFN